MEGCCVVEIRPDLGMIYPVVGGRVQVESDCALVDDLFHEEVGETRCSRSPSRSGEGAVQVPSIGQVSGLDYEAERVDDGHCDHCAPQVLGVEFLDHLADYLYAVELVAVNCRREPDVWAGRPAVYHLHRERFGCPRHHPGKRQLDLDFSPRSNGYVTDGDRVVYLLRYQRCLR